MSKISIEEFLNKEKKSGTDRVHKCYAKKSNVNMI